MPTLKSIDVVPYDKAWPEDFQRETALVWHALGSNCIAIHHIGSTSVPGLMAKPKIDIIVVVHNAAQTIDKLSLLGFRYKGEYNIPLHYGFSKRETPDVNLHVYEEGHGEIELNLMFRDYLRTNPKACADYTALKLALLSDQSSFEKNKSPFTNYTLRKGVFIRGILKKTGFKQVRMLKCNDDTEWAAAKHFRAYYFFNPRGIEDPYTWTFNHKDHTHLILYEGTEIVGYGHIQLWPDERVALRMMVIDEAKRNGHLGTEFLALCEKWLKRHGYKSLHAESTQAALGFYKKNGYIDTAFNDPDGYESNPGDKAVGKIL